MWFIDESLLPTMDGNFERHIFFLFLTIYFCPVCFVFSWFDIFFLENPLEGLYLDVSAWRFTGNNDSIIFI